MYKLSEITRINICKEDFTCEPECELMTWDEADAYIKEHSPCWSNLADVLTEINDTYVGSPATGTVVHNTDQLKLAIWKEVAPARKSGKHPDDEFVVMMPGHHPREVLTAEFDVLKGHVASGQAYDYLHLKQERKHLYEMEVEVGNRTEAELLELRNILKLDD